ncbi:MAG: BREX system ATP-binding domain-containing protein [Bacillota bacterium]
MNNDVMDCRRALEALRNGVPNRDAVRVLGCGQSEVERRFSDQLASVESAVQEERQVPGLLIAGGFGTGKSHLLEYLKHVALSKNFVCSRVVISKETPLYDPPKVYAAAIEAAVVPGLNGQAIKEIAHRLQPDSQTYAEFFQWANRDDSGVSALFPATLLLHERLQNDQEMVEEITSFWSGEKLPIKRARDGLKQIGQTSAFVLKTVPVRELAMQRFGFAARLFLGAGYRGWVLLIDEVELIGRYNLLQRGKSYAELARWMGKIEGQQYPGLTAVAAITDDFTLAVLMEKGDRDSVRPKLQSKETDEFMTLAARAESGMRIIERDTITLSPPNLSTLKHTYEQLKEIYRNAYGWSPPDFVSPEMAVRKAMRSYVRRWINEWDLKRLFPGVDVRIEEHEVKPGYEEDKGLEQDTDPSGTDEILQESG